MQVHATRGDLDAQRAALQRALRLEAAEAPLAVASTLTALGECLTRQGDVREGAARPSGLRTAECESRRSVFHTRLAGESTRFHSLLG